MPRDFYLLSYDAEYTDNDVALAASQELPPGVLANALDAETPIQSRGILLTEFVKGAVTTGLQNPEGDFPFEPVTFTDLTESSTTADVADAVNELKANLNALIGALGAL